MSEEKITEGTEKKPKSKVIAYILWLFLGMFGAHNFYLGRIKWGLLYLFTLGIVWVVWFWVDLFILSGQVDAYNGVKPKEKKPRSKGVTFALWLFLGILGAHKFYLGREGMGKLYLCTLGCVLVGWLLDIFTLFAQVDVCNGLRSKEDAGLLQGILNMQKVSKGLQSVGGAIGGGQTCSYCGQNFIEGAAGRCHRSPSGHHQT